MTGPIEPSAEVRQAASQLWQIFAGLKNEGFTEYQALVIIGQILAAQNGQSKP